MSEGKLGAWIRWILFSEGLILLLAVAGPGYRHAAVKEGDRGLIARFFIDDPTFLQEVAVNVLALHVVIGGAWATAWIVGRFKKGG